MPVVDKLMTFSMAVSDMPKSKAFYVDKLGFKVATDYRKDDNNWWASAISCDEIWGQTRRSPVSPTDRALVRGGRQLRGARPARIPKK